MVSLLIPKVERLSIFTNCAFWVPVNPADLKRTNVIRYFDGMTTSPSYVVASDAVVENGEARFQTKEVTVTMDMLGPLNAQ